MAYHISAEICIECGECFPVCNTNAIVKGSPYKIEPDYCTDCGSCSEVCSVDAISAE